MNNKCMCGHDDRDHMGNGWGADTFCLRGLDDGCTEFCTCKKYVPRGTMLA